jgi:hypothetical protein
MSEFGSGWVGRVDWRRASGGVLALLLLVSPSLAFADANQTRASMKEIFSAMRPLLIHALKEERFEEPENRAEIARALTLLERSSAQLAGHGKDRGPGFEHLGALLASDAREAHRRWHEKDVEAARFLVLQMTETCVACHSRLPSGRDSSLSRRFADESVIAGLPLDQRALVEYATRQFSTALESYEALLVSPDYAARDIDMMGHLDEYLEICIRVRNEPDRAIQALNRFAERPDTPRVLKQEIASWVQVLAERPLPAKPSLAAAQSLIDDARDAAPGQNDRDGLVEYLSAGAILHQLLEDGIADNHERARALYLLGVIDTRVGRSFWLSQAETFLEAAIRAAPATDVARDSFDLLEEYLIAGYTGSGGEQVPSDVADHLETLRALITTPAGSEI